MSEGPFKLNEAARVLYEKLWDRQSEHWGPGVPTLTSNDWRTGYQRAMGDIFELCGDSGERSEFFSKLLDRKYGR